MTGVQTCALPIYQSSAPCWKPVAGEQRRRIPGCTWTLQVMPGFQSQQNSAMAGGVDLPCFREVNRASCAGSQCGGGDAGTRTAAPQEANSRKGKRSPPDLRTAFQAFADPSTGHSSHCRRSGSSGCQWASGLVWKGVPRAESLIFGQGLWWTLHRRHMELISWARLGSRWEARRWWGREDAQESL